MMERTIAQRELRNNVGEVLRRAEAGAQFTITVRGRPVAHLGPVTGVASRRRDVDRGTLLRIVSETPVDAQLAEDVARLRETEEPVGEPWVGQ